MIDERALAHLSSYPERKTAVLYGCETHICVKQTALDLMATGYTVHVVVDAVTSMGIADRNVGLAALQDSGARLTTFQQLVFDLIQTSVHPEFRTILAITKEATDPQMPLDLVTREEHLTAWKRQNEEAQKQK